MMYSLANDARLCNKVAQSEHIFSFQSSEAHPTVMLFALIALEKFSQTSRFSYYEQINVRIMLLKLKYFGAY